MHTDKGETPAADTLTIERTAASIAFDAILKERGLSPRVAAGRLTEFGRCLVEFGGEAPPGGKPLNVAHPMVIDWRQGKGRPGPRYRKLIRLWARTVDPETRTVMSDPIPEDGWLYQDERLGAAADIPPAA